MTIKKLEETQSKTGKPMVKIAIDFIAPDAQAGYFTQVFKDDVRPDKKWPNNGMLYILTEDEKGQCSRSFKRFITSVEKSNNGFVTQWGENFGAQFKGKRLGGVFGIVEDEYNGKVTKKHQLRWVCHWDNVATASVPEPKLLPDNNVRSSSAPSASAPVSQGGFVNIPDGVDEEVPF
jgi:hypothetical protein